MTLCICSLAHTAELSILIKNTCLSSHTQTQLLEHRWARWLPEYQLPQEQGALPNGHLPQHNCCYFMPHSSHLCYWWMTDIRFLHIRDMATVQEMVMSTDHITRIHIFMCWKSKGKQKVYVVSCKVVNNGFISADDFSKRKNWQRPSISQAQRHISTLILCIKDGKGNFSRDGICHLCSWHNGQAGNSVSQMGILTRDVQYAAGYYYVCLFF